MTHEYLKTIDVKDTALKCINDGVIRVLVETVENFKEKIWHEMIDEVIVSVVDLSSFRLYTSDNTKEWVIDIHSRIDCDIHNKEQNIFSFLEDQLQMQDIDECHDFYNKIEEWAKKQREALKKEEDE